MGNPAIATALRVAKIRLVDDRTTVPPPHSKMGKVPQKRQRVCRGPTPSSLKKLNASSGAIS
jgi:hypothetical protein